MQSHKGWEFPGEYIKWNSKTRLNVGVESAESLDNIKTLSVFPFFYSDCFNRKSGENWACFYAENIFNLNNLEPNPRVTGGILGLEISWDLDRRNPDHAVDPH